MLVTGTLWGMFENFWRSRSDAQKSVSIAVAIVLIALLGWSVAHAENAPDSNFGVYTTGDGSVSYACYMSQGIEEPKVGTIYTCLVMQVMGPMLVANGMVTHCTVTSYEANKPWVTCGKYDDMKKISGGV